MLFYILLAFLALSILFYKHMTRNFGYFSSRGVPEVPPSFPFGSHTHKRVVSGKVSFVTSSEELYKEYHGHAKMLGHYAFDAPHLLILDLDLAKSIMIKDFDYFTDRRSVHGLNVKNPVNKINMNMLTMLKVV